MSLAYHRAFVALAAPEFDRLIHFYQQLLEQDPQPFVPHRYAEFQFSGGLRLAIFPPQVEQEPQFYQVANSPFSLCLQVDNLDDSLFHLQQLGCRYDSILQASHGREIYAYDPLGNRIIFYEPKAAEGQGC